MMRVPKMQQLLHDVDGRRRAGAPGGARAMARVALHFDNSDRIIPVASDSVVVTRDRLTRAASRPTTSTTKRTAAPTSRTSWTWPGRARGPKQLNVVQQGTVTRISEYTPTERRNIIEDLTRHIVV